MPYDARTYLSRTKAHTLSQKQGKTCPTQGDKPAGTERALYLPAKKCSKAKAHFQAAQWLDRLLAPDALPGLRQGGPNLKTFYRWGKLRGYLNPGLLDLSHTDIWGWIILCCGSRPVPCRTFSSVSGLYPRDANSTPHSCELQQPKISAVG